MQKMMELQLPDAADFQTVAEVFKQLGDATRLRIFWVLCHAEACVSELAAATGVSGAAVSHHLRLLRSSALVSVRREGKEVFYRASDARQSALLHEMMEQVMEITCPQEASRAACDENLPQSEPSDRSALMHRIHDELVQDLSCRVTIEEISRRYGLNPTTLKADFKAVYGMSLAAHIKEHRMEKAAELLRASSMSVAQIAERVGYESQSKFTAAFKSYYGATPMEYRK